MTSHGRLCRRQVGLRAFTCSYVGTREILVPSSSRHTYRHAPSNALVEQSYSKSEGHHAVSVGLLLKQQSYIGRTQHISIQYDDEASRRLWMPVVLL